MNHDPLRDSKRSIQHAHRRMKEFNRELIAFHGLNPYARVTEPNADGTQDIHKIKLNIPIPDELSFIAWEAANSLRSSLDQAGYALARATGSRGKDAYFPFGDCLKEAMSRHAGKSKQIPKKLFDLMISFEPYKGGNDLLWAINKISNSHKHQAVTVTAIHVCGGNFAGSLQGPASITWPPRWDRVKNEMILGSLRRGDEWKNDFEVLTCITFADVEIVSRQPVDGVLSDQARIVESIILGIEAEAMRSGIF